MELLHLTYFRTLARTENMTKTAAMLHVAQPALSRTLANLERELGVKLFDRVGRRLVLNECGRIFLHHVEKIFDDLQQTRRELLDVSGQADKRILIGATNTQLLPALFTRYMQGHPDALIRQMQIAGRAEIPRRLIRGDFDLCITSMPIDQPQGAVKITKKPIITEKLVLATASQDERPDGPVDVASLKEACFVQPAAEDGLSDIIKDLCQKKHFQPNVVFESNSPETILQMVEAGFGIAIVPESWITSRYSASLKMHPLNPPCQRTIWLAWIHGRYMTQESRHFRDFLLGM